MLGELVQWDSSVHAWLEDRGPGDLVLVALHDDATDRMLHGQFVERDTGAANRRAIIACMKRHGRPLAVYADHAAHFGQRARDGKRTKSVIARGLEKLGVELILAGSAQAKGRVERTFGTAQDRLVKEMRVAGVATLEAANRFLAERWIPFWNARFAVAAAEPGDAHRPLPPEVDLEALFAETATRTVARDYTVRWKNEFWQIPEAEARAAGVRPGRRVVVERRLSGELRFRRGARYFAAEPLGAARWPAADPSAASTTRDLPFSPQDHIVSYGPGRHSPEALVEPPFGFAGAGSGAIGKRLRHGEEGMSTASRKRAATLVPIMGTPSLHRKVPVRDIASRGLGTARCRSNLRRRRPRHGPCEALEAFFRKVGQRRLAAPPTARPTPSTAASKRSEPGVATSATKTASPTPSSSASAALNSVRTLSSSDPPCPARPPNAASLHHIRRRATVLRPYTIMRRNLKWRQRCEIP